eukprot:scaffold1605_cov141-Cylindrotheca_fusiformis.AAC.9
MWRARRADDDTTVTSGSTYHGGQKSDTLGFRKTCHDKFCGKTRIPPKKSSLMRLGHHRRTATTTSPPAANRSYRVCSILHLNTAISFARRLCLEERSKA